VINMSLVVWIQLIGMIVQVGFVASAGITGWCGCLVAHIGFYSINNLK
jgi:hypothetical protein